MKILILFSFLALSLAGCSKEITSFVTGGPSRPGAGEATPPVSSANPHAVKISPGSNISEGSEIKSRFSITPTRKTATGTQVKSLHSFHLNRPE